ncbi:peptidoglycan editing factor PgeF [Vibrio marisflavi]|uniref:Purine nucleoside phosphorylase n=1 Tax=Vibrio marisflavi CECT 7928 TaxID=634439 RepID=A0ABM9A7P4_9VIBR|nr:peptidoglycan editing factor PgeF [Vibrio marisflavi]CAH0541097.1 Polyphenol oxidase [Vibrio marisflavi CECT 7928]
MSFVVPNWPAPKRVKALSTTRIGGFSHPPYQGLNLGQHVGDDPSIVANNRKWLVGAAGLPTSPVWLNQTHSTHIVELDKSINTILDADGSVTTQDDVVCSVMTADCLPVLLTNIQGTQVAAVHAGWRGLADGILENAVYKMQGELLAWLGPAIGESAFEVGDDVRDLFISHDNLASKGFVATSKQGKWMANMQLLAKQRLNSVGVTQIYSSELCTFQHSDKFFSYRRDGVTGRQASLIWISRQN